ncbi:DUF6480 family protein [Streptomyces sp. NPDC001595]|uniref:DUF6480 family protein n=1 Tax=Streptomyces sp. NPDC001532 TaxID=3154520 RepID=UPI00332FC371
MTESLHPPGETPPVEGSTAEAHPERPDGGVWEHPHLWLFLIVIGCLLIAGFFVARVIDL